MKLNRNVVFCLLVCVFFAGTCSPAWSAGTEVKEKAKSKTAVTATELKDKTKSKSKTAASGLTEKININTATAAELMQLQKIGEKTAASLIEYRTKNGPFKSIDELKKVKGIGDKIFELNKNRVSTEMVKTDDAVKKVEKVADTVKKTKTEIPVKPAAPKVKTEAKTDLKKK